VYFNVNFNVFFKLIKVHLLVSELYIHQNARFNNKNCIGWFTVRYASAQLWNILNFVQSVSVQC